jgi:N-acyl-D-aspartate/D-glutamate deacylase
MRIMRQVLIVAFAVCLTAAVDPAVGQGRDTADVLIRGGTLVDGTGGASRRADVAVRGDRIVFVGNAASADVRAQRTIDATGLIVAPGFIDPHAHALEDLTSADANRRANLDYLMQGVTTVITGNDGGGPVEVARTRARCDSLGIGTNVALLVGQGAVRRMVMGMSDAKPSPAALDSMRALIAKGMREGAFGMSTGLYYAPGSYASTEEVIELAKIAARAGGIYDSHLRDESSYTIGLLAAVREALRIGREAGLPAHISHIKALGADVWGRSDSVIAIVRAARAAGQPVTADQYPYTASGTSLGASLLPRWAEVGGRDSLRARASDPATRRRLVAEMTENLRRRGGARTLLITSSRDPSLVGRTLDQIGESRNGPPIDVALRIILDGDASVASFNMQDHDLEAFVVEPWVMTGSDGSGGHPRKYGTFPRKYRLYVAEKKLLTLEQFVQRSSSLTAATFGLTDRGVIAEGKFADVVVIDTRTFTDRSTYEAPDVLATGVRYALVNGQIAVDAGKPGNVRAGRALVHRSGS